MHQINASVIDLHWFIYADKYSVKFKKVEERKQPGEV